MCRDIFSRMFCCCPSSPFISAFVQEKLPSDETSSKNYYYSCPYNCQHHESLLVIFYRRRVSQFAFFLFLLTFCLFFLCHFPPSSTCQIVPIHTDNLYFAMYMPVK